MNREDLIKHLGTQGISKQLIKEIEDFTKEYPVDESLEERIPNSIYSYYGKEVWEMAINALLEGYHLLLSGPKATGKNVLSENLAQLFKRPVWNISLNVNSDAGSLIGVDTFKDGEVVLKKGPVTLAAETGSIAIFDEINMAKNESLSVVHSALDYRRIIDVPGYDRITLHPASRFIGTMNYGYMGTRELNEALVSRFLVIDMPILHGENLTKILKDETPLNDNGIDRFRRLFMDLQEKSLQGEISSKPVDMRGIFAAVDLMEKGLAIYPALKLGIVNKSFDAFEKEIVTDVIKTLFNKNMDPKELF